MNTSQALVPPPGPAPYRTINLTPVEKELTIRDLLSVFTRRRTIILSTVAVCLTAAILVCLFSTRMYLASAEIQVQKEQSSQLGLDTGESAESGTSDALQDNISLQTQANILQSDSLALKVIRDLKLAHTEDFKPRFNPIGWVLGLISPSGPSDAQLGPSTDVDLGLSPRERMHVLDVFNKNLKVKPVSGTRLIDISYLSSSPRLAAEVVNHLVQGLTDYNFATRHDATARTAQYLMGQLSDLRQQSEDLEAKVAHAQRESGIVSLGGVDAQGRQQVYSAVLDKLQQATTAYTQAQSNRIAKEAVLRAAQTGDPEAVSSLSGSAMFSSSGTDTSLGLIQGLHMQQATLDGQIAETAAKFGPAYPKLDEMRERLGALTSSIATEVHRMADRAKKDVEVARGVEENTRKVYANLKGQADSLNDKAINYTILHQEADQSRTLYDTLFKQLKQAGILADFKVSNISVVDPARVPAKPAKPNVLLYLAASICGGLFLGGCGALLRDTLDNRIHDLPELEAYLGEVPLGVLPYHKGDRELKSGRPTSALNAPSVSMALSNSENRALPAAADPHAPYTEALRALRTSLMLSRSGAPPQVVLITSSVSGEGKSMLSVNLAALLAQQKECKVLLVEGDLRRPVIARRLNLKTETGLTSVLAAQNSRDTALSSPVSIEGVPGLRVLPAGPVPPYPAELLGSQQMAEAIEVWRKHFDIIIIDGAPVLPVTDSVVLSRHADLTLVVARHTLTKRQSLERSCRLLQSQNSQKQVGVVLNAVQRTSESYYQYYGYKKSAYYGNEQHA